MILPKLSKSLICEKSIINSIQINQKTYYIVNTFAKQKNKNWTRYEKNVMVKLINYQIWYYLDNYGQININ